MIRRVAKMFGTTGAGAILVLAAVTAHAQLQVFAGDPVDADTGWALTILPGVPLVLPGPDGLFDTEDDLVDPSVVGDVDVVIRSGGTFTGGAIPLPHASVADAPAVIAGGVRIGLGNEVPFQVILSDGLPPAIAGNPLSNVELDDRGTLVFAYGDLDGDGFIGPRAADGEADLQIERQEVLAPVGRTLGRITGGVAAATIATSIGAPPSHGGLGVVLSAGVATGSNPWLFEDGPWVSTMAPAMFPLEQARIIGGEAGQVPDAIGIVDLELEEETIFIPATNDPELGSAYAIPLDGSSPTVDLLRSESAEASRAVFVEPVVPETFVASTQRRVLPAVDESGARALAEIASRITLPCDGGASRAALALMPADLLGNPADPPVGGTTVVLQASPLLRIASPDADGDPSREEIAFADARWVQVEIDDAGQPLVQPAAQHVFVLRGGELVEALRVDLLAAPVATLASARVKLLPETAPGRDRLAADATFVADPTADLTASPLAIRIADTSGTIFERFLPAGSLVANDEGRTFRFHDHGSAVPPLISRLTIRRSRLDPTQYTLKLRVKRLDMGGSALTLPALDLQIGAAGDAFAAPLDCTPGSRRLVCAPPVNP